MSTPKTTVENLNEAFAGESLACQKYLAFAKKAEREGYSQVARLFRAAAKAETVHAAGHLQALEKVKSTRENLEAAVAGETHEFRDMYPPMLEQAQKEGHRAKTMFAFAVKAEEVHAKLYQLALEAVNAGHDLEGAEIYLCPVCGHLEIGQPGAKCPICGLAPEKFEQVS